MNLTPENAPDAPAASDAAPTPLLDHERLDVYHVALEFAGLVPALTHGARSSLRDQLECASASICLNLADKRASATCPRSVAKRAIWKGCGARRDRFHFFSIAQGSAMECAAAIAILRVNGHVTLAGARAKATDASGPLTSESVY